MNYFEALYHLELDELATKEDLKEQFRWFCKTYHPDNPKTGDAKEFALAVKAYQILTSYFNTQN